LLGSFDGLGFDCAGILGTYEFYGLGNTFTLSPGGGVISSSAGTVGFFANTNDQIVSFNSQFGDIYINPNGAGTKIGATAAYKWSFWGADPIVQPSTTGETVGFTQGTGNNVKEVSTFTGGVGTTTYRDNDIVKHLKNFGVIAK